MALREAGAASMAYFYCDFRDEDKQSHRNILLSILFQLSAQSDLCFEALSNLHSKHDEGAQKPSDGTLLKCLNDVLSSPAQNPVFLSSMPSMSALTMQAYHLLENKSLTLSAISLTCAITIYTFV